MNQHSRPRRDQAARGGHAPWRAGAPGGAAQPWKVRAQQRAPGGPGTHPREGKILAPRSKEMAPPRQRGRWLTVGVPSVLGGMFGISSFIVLGVSSLVGGAGLVAPLLAGLGIGVVVGGGSAVLLRNRRPQPVRLSAAGAEMPVGTRTMLEKIVKSTTRQRRQLARVRRKRPDPAVKPVLNRADALLQRIDALMGSTTLQSRRPSDADVMVLEGMAARYIPDLVSALEDTVVFLAPSTGAARDKAFANLESIDQQLQALGEDIERIENDVVAGVTRSLDVHSEFLKNRLATQHRSPLIDG